MRLWIAVQQEERRTVTGVTRGDGRARRVDPDPREAVE